MTTSKRLQPIIRLAEQQEKTRAVAFKNSQMQLQQKVDQLHSLRSYAMEYKNTLTQTGASFAPQKWQMTCAFIKQLNQMQVLQKQTIHEAQQVVKARSRDWQVANNRYKALCKLRDRYKQREQVALSRQEQKLLDEIAQQLARFNSDCG